jgi:putative transposase
MARIFFSGRRFKQELILQSVRWYLAYALSCRDIEEMMQERGINVDYSTIHRWVIHYAAQLDKEFRTKKRKPCRRWRLDETYMKVKGQWKYYYRAADKQGETIDFLLTAKRDKRAALRYLRNAIGPSLGGPV